MTKFRTCTAGLLLALLVVLAPPARAASHSATNVSGTWQSVVNVLFTNYQPSASDPTTGTYQGVGSTLWQGTWTGVTHYMAHGTANLITGAGSGALQETFTGRSSGGGTGTLTFNETYTLSSTGAIVIQAKIIGATDDFSGAHGDVTFTGTDNPAEGGGSFQGRWSLPRR